MRPQGYNRQGRLTPAALISINKAMREVFKPKMRWNPALDMWTCSRCDEVILTSEAQDDPHLPAKHLRTHTA